jgi:hypothetical protein
MSTFASASTSLREEFRLDGGIKPQLFHFHAGNRLVQTWTAGEGGARRLMP